MRRRKRRRKVQVQDEEKRCKAHLGIDQVNVHLLVHGTV